MQDVSTDQERIADAQDATSDLVIQVANAVTRGVPISMLNDIITAGIAHAQTNMPSALHDAQADAARLDAPLQCVVPRWADVPPRPALRLVDDEDPDPSEIDFSFGRLAA